MAEIKTSATTPKLDRIQVEYPRAEGLFDPKREHDACGVGFIADLKKRSSHKIVVRRPRHPRNLEHRGAVGADPLSGDETGILIQFRTNSCSPSARS